MTTQPLTFPALHDIETNMGRLVAIKRQFLTPVLSQPALLTQYADDLVQKQNQTILSKSLQTSQQLSQLISKIIAHLNASSRYLKPNKKYNFLQKWLGIDLEQQAGSVGYLNELNRLVKEADHLSQRVATEIYQTQKNMQTLHELRVEMAHYVVAAEEFLQDVYLFASADQIENIKERLHKKVNTLMTSQSATDMAMLQIQLSQNIAMTILDRFNEAKNILIPAWQQHVLQAQQAKTPQDLQRLNEARDRLIQTLDHAIKTNQTPS